MTVVFSRKPVDMGEMGLIHAPFQLSNPRVPGGPIVEVEALVDTGAVSVCLPASLAERLGLEVLEQREVTLADGGRHLVPHVGPIKVGFGRRGCYTGAYVLGERVLMGAIPLEDMDLVIDPLRRRVSVNPASPDIATGIVMGAARRQKPLLDLMGKLEWNSDYDYKAERSRRWPSAWQA